MCVRSIWSTGYGATTFAKIPAPNRMISPTRPPMASRWRRNRLRAYDHWLRVLISRPASIVGSTRPITPGCAMSLTCATSGLSSPSGGSVIADPWVEEPVEDVCDQVEGDDDHGR